MLSCLPPALLPSNNLSLYLPVTTAPAVSTQQKTPKQRKTVINFILSLRLLRLVCPFRFSPYLVSAEYATLMLSDAARRSDASIQSPSHSAPPSSSHLTLLVKANPNNLATRALIQPQSIQYPPYWSALLFGTCRPSGHVLPLTTRRRPHLLSQIVRFDHFTARLKALTGIDAHCANIMHIHGMYPLQPSPAGIGFRLPGSRTSR